MKTNIKQRIVILGRPISKKRHYRNKAGGGFFLSKTYKDFEESALWQLKSFPVNFKGPVSINYKFFLKGKLFLDPDNAEASINDILQTAGIIENDKYIIEHSTIMIPANKEWKTELNIKKLMIY